MDPGESVSDSSSGEEIEMSSLSDSAEPAVPVYDYIQRIDRSIQLRRNILRGIEEQLAGLREQCNAVLEEKTRLTKIAERARASLFTPRSKRHAYENEARSKTVSDIIKYCQDLRMPLMIDMIKQANDIRATLMQKNFRYVIDRRGEGIVDEENPDGNLISMFGPLSPHIASYPPRRTPLQGRRLQRQR